jgi:hypothetical protein
MTKALYTTRVELREANEFIAALHRHHKQVVGHRFSLGCSKDGSLVGVATVGRPVARMIDQKMVAEVTRLCTDGTKNACSFLYSACARIARELGFIKIQTYILDDESGASLIAAGWSLEKTTDGGSWNRAARNGRREDQPQGKKRLYAKILREASPAPRSWRAS